MDPDRGPVQLVKYNNYYLWYKMKLINHEILFKPNISFKKITVQKSSKKRLKRLVSRAVQAASIIQPTSLLLSLFSKS